MRQNIFGEPNASMAVFAYVVPEGTMKHDILLGRDSWEPFPIRQEKDESETEIIASFKRGKETGGPRTAVWESGLERQ